jgi:hypothetical protein
MGESWGNSSHPKLVGVIWVNRLIWGTLTFLLLLTVSIATTEIAIIATSYESSLSCSDKLFNI